MHKAEGLLCSSTDRARNVSAHVRVRIPLEELGNTTVMCCQRRHVPVRWDACRREALTQQCRTV